MNSAPWDGFRRIAAWSGLLEIVAVVVIAVLVGAEMGRAAGAVVVATLAPGALAGLVSGSRFFGLYAGLATRPDLTAELSESEAARGSGVVGDMMGDAAWGTVIAAAAGGAAGALALTPVLGVGAALVAPLLSLTVGIAWFTGWAAGFVAASILSVSLGLAVGQSHRADRVGRLLALLVAALLPALLVAVVLAVVGVQFDGATDGWSGLLVLLGAPLDGARFVLGIPLLWVGRIAAWASVVLLAALIAVVIPAALLRRR